MMQQVSVDLLKKNKNKWRISLGILLIICAGYWLYFRIAQYSEIRLFDWAYIFIFILNGVMHIMEGSGYSFNKLFGKAFVSINTELISFKTRINKAVQTVYWKDVKSLEIKSAKLSIQKLDNHIEAIDLAKLDYAMIKEIKKNIETLATEKGIDVHL